MEFLFRVAVLGLLLRIDSTLTQLVRGVRVLRVIAEHPLPTMEFTNNSIAVRDTDWSRNAFPEGLKPGAHLKQPAGSFSASPETTEAGPGTTAPTAATGRWTLTSGPLTADERSQRRRRELDEVRRTLLPIGDTSPEAGSPGPAPESLDIGPDVGYPDTSRHDTCGYIHREGAPCPIHPTLSRPISQQEIRDQGYEPICVPSIRGSDSNHNLHGHVRGAKLDG